MNPKKKKLSELQNAHKMLIDDIISLIQTEILKSPTSALDKASTHFSQSPNHLLSNTFTHLPNFPKHAEQPQNLPHACLKNSNK